MMEVFEATDITLPGRGPSLTFRRTYRSKTRLVTPLGYGWTHNYREHIQSTTDCSTIQWFSAGMWAGNFVAVTSTKWLGPPGTYMKLHAYVNSNGVVTSYKLITRDTVEEKILILQNRKREIIQATIGGEEEFTASLSWEEIQELLN